jgi:hypothetical protein
MKTDEIVAICSMSGKWLHENQVPFSSSKLGGSLTNIGEP